MREWCDKQVISHLAFIPALPIIWLLLLSDHPSHKVVCMDSRLKSEAQSDIHGEDGAFPEENFHFTIAAPQAVLGAEDDMVKISRALNPHGHFQHIVLVVSDANCSRVLYFILSHKNHANFFRHGTKITQRCVCSCHVGDCTSACFLVRAWRHVA